MFLRGDCTRTRFISCQEDSKSCLERNVIRVKIRRGKSDSGHESSLSFVESKFVGRDALLALTQHRSCDEFFTFLQYMFQIASIHTSKYLSNILYLHSFMTIQFPAPLPSHRLHHRTLRCHPPPLRSRLRCPPPAVTVVRIRP